MSRGKNVVVMSAALMMLAAGAPAHAQDAAASDCESAVSRQNLMLIGTGTPVAAGQNQFRVPMTVSRGDGGFDITCRWDGRTRRAVLDGIAAIPARDQGHDARNRCAAAAQIRGFNVSGAASAQKRDQSTWRVTLNVANNDPRTIECWYTTDGQAVVDALPQSP